MHVTFFKVCVFVISVHKLFISDLRLGHTVEFSDPAAWLWGFSNRVCSRHILLLRWSSGCQEGGDQEQDPGDWKDGSCLLRAQVCFIFLKFGEVYTKMRLALTSGPCLEAGEGLSPFSVWFLSFFLFLIVTLKCGIMRLLEHGTESFAPLWFKANEFLSHLHLSSFDSVEVCQNNLSLKCDCSSSENVSLLF